MGHFRVSLLAVSKQVFVLNLCYQENELDLHENEPADGTHFHTEPFAPRFILTEAKGSEMAYYTL